MYWRKDLDLQLKVFDGTEHGYSQRWRGHAEGIQLVLKEYPCQAPKAEVPELVEATDKERTLYT